MKLVILTSNSLRHVFFINYLLRNHNVVGVVMEEKKRDYSKKGEDTEFDSAIKKYFNDRHESEKKYFGNHEKIEINNDLIVKIKGGQLNDNFVLDKIKNWNPDYIAVFGSSLLNKELIKLLPSKRIINMHLGLSPYYRGSGTNFWPLYDEKPQYVGATIHYLDIGIDSGDIIKQGRPEIVLGDTPHSIGNKAIIKGTEIMSDVLKNLERGAVINGAKQNLKQGKLCLFKDCEPKHIIKLMKKWDNCLIEKYLSDKNIQSNIQLVDSLK